MKDSVVKIDSELEREIEELIKRERYVYSSKKQVVNLAIIEFLNKNKRLNEKGGKEKA
jgi:metal-responsive CopG/Arc/MetJ family transcriptional regulator